MKTYLILWSSHYDECGEGPRGLFVRRSVDMASVVWC